MPCIVANDSCSISYLYTSLSDDAGRRKTEREEQTQGAMQVEVGGERGGWQISCKCCPCDLQVAIVTLVTTQRQVTAPASTSLQVSHETVQHTHNHVVRWIRSFNPPQHTAKSPAVFVVCVRGELCGEKFYKFICLGRQHMRIHNCTPPALHHRALLP